MVLCQTIFVWKCRSCWSSWVTFGGSRRRVALTCLLWRLLSPRRRHYVDFALCVLTSAAAAKQNSGIEDITHPGQAQRGVSLRQWLFWKKRAPQAKIKVTFQVIIGKNYIPIVSKQINPTTTENHLQENKLTMMPPTRLLSTFVSSSSMRVTAQQSRSLSSQSNVAAQKLKNALEEYRRRQ